MQVTRNESWTPTAFHANVVAMEQGALEIAVLERAAGRCTDPVVGGLRICSDGRAIAKEAARSMVGLYALSLPDELVKRNGVAPDELAPALAALGAGDLAGAIDATPPATAEKLSIAGTPAEVVAKLQDIAAAGVNHMILAITDAILVKTLMGREIDGVADVDTQLRLIHDKVMPEFA